MELGVWQDRFVLDRQVDFLGRKGRLVCYRFLFRYVFTYVLSFFEVFVYYEQRLVGKGGGGKFCSISDDVIFVFLVLGYFIQGYIFLDIGFFYFQVFFKVDFGM